jgi:uncharacterized membrane protein
MLKCSATLIFACALALSACGDEEDEEGQATGATCPSDSTLNYQNFGQPFMATYCLKCHSSTLTGAARNGAPADHNFDSLEGIQEFADHIDRQAGSGPDATNTIMPLAGFNAPTTEERAKLSQWLACGAP